MKPFTTYKQALNYIYSHTNFERKQMPKYNMTTLDLSRIQSVLARLGDPHLQFPVVLIAGTKGKGSTAAMCHSILQAAGYKTGLYSSPHLHTFRERIRVGDRLISEEAVISLVNELRAEFDRVFGLTAWEIITTLAFVTFARQPVDIAVLEVGLGGRLDATNVTEPAVSVITSISYDHTHLLGNTLSSIAREKAGIIREGGVVVSAPQFSEPMTVIEEVCQEKHARLIVVGDEKPWRVGRISLKSQTLYLDGEVYTVPLLGEHQAANAATALTAIQALQTRLNLAIPQTALHAGLASVRWPGRLEILSLDPLLIVDSAMNGDSAHKLRRTLEDYFPGREVVLLFGASRDHDYPAMLRELLPHTRRVIVTQANHPRATPPDVLAAMAQTLGYPVAATADVSRALEMALEDFHERDLICVAGSLFLAADARRAWAEMADLPVPETDPV
ncbi:MAG: bifunctional folylpolyglutamate synthase/dihydrofolate synthase [Caldilineae bacterium]|nr:MAG: bifunctional folylpolyglutamate synthase/dihydrofolate synthase [Caldilineae bacterium]